MATAVEPYKQLLHEGGLPADLTERMVAAANELDALVRAALVQAYPVTQASL